MPRACSSPSRAFLRHSAAIVLSTSSGSSCLVVMAGIVPCRVAFLDKCLIAATQALRVDAGGELASSSSISSSSPFFFFSTPRMEMNNESTPSASWGPGSSALQSVGLHRYIARTLRVSARHLPWETAQQLHAEHQVGEGDEAMSSHRVGLRIVELDDFSWRADVTADNIAAAQALGWHALRRLLRLAQTYQCEALEIAPGSLVLPAVLEVEVFPWP